MSIGASPSGKAAGFGPAISEVRILSPQFFIFINSTKKQPLYSPSARFFKVSPALWAKLDDVLALFAYLEA